VDQTADHRRDPLAGADRGAVADVPAPHIWLHVLPYGEVKLNMRARLALGKNLPSP
jgi:hypothetical protein